MIYLFFYTSFKRVKNDKLQEPSVHQILRQRSTEP